MKERTTEQHNAKMKKIKGAMDKRIAAADEERGIIVLITGNGKGKSSSAFGMIMRALGHGQKVSLVQFIKQGNSCGEQLYLSDKEPNLQQVSMDTGFTWNTQDKEGDIAAAEKTWAEAEIMLADSTIDLVVLDELTYMMSYHYLDSDRILTALVNRPPMQNVIVTGRGATDELIEISDTVSEIKEVKHAFAAGVKAQKGIEF